MTGKVRITVSLDPELVKKAETAVAAGAAPNVSAWVAAAMADKAANETRDRAWDEFIEIFEAEHGEITEQDMLEAQKYYAARSFVVDGRKGPSRSAAKRRAGRSTGNAECQ